MHMAIGGGLFLLGLGLMIGGFGAYSKYGALIHLGEVFLALTGAVVFMLGKF